MDSCLDISKYEDHVLPGDLREYEVTLEKPQRKSEGGKDGLKERPREGGENYRGKYGKKHEKLQDMLQGGGE